jgi:hypothetical protein
MDTQLIVFKYDTDASFDFQDTYLAPSVYGNKLGLEFIGDITDTLFVGQTITIDKNDKSINPWADGVTTILGIEPSSIYPPPGCLVFTNRDLQLPITYSSGEDGVINFVGENLEYEFYESLDLRDDGTFPLTFSIADIRNPDKRNSTFSKTITLPGTKKNNKFFGSIFEVGIDDTFDVTKKVQAVVYQQGLEQLNGVLQLKKIIRDDFNNISYEVNLFGQLANIFYNLGDLKLCDLNFDEYDHIYNYSSITESWNTSIRKNGSQYINFQTGYTTTFTDTEFLEGKVVLITSGAHSFNIGDTVWVEKDDDTINPIYNGMSTVIQIPASDKIMINKLWGSSSVLESGTVYVKNTTGEGYVYPFLEYGNNTIPSSNSLDARRKKFTTILNPAVYTKTVVDKIFQAAKFTYNSEFFESPYFKRLILPYVGEYYQKDNNQIQLQEFRAGNTGSTQVYFQNVIGALNESRYLNFNADSSNGTTTIDCYDNNNNYFPNLNTGTFYPSGRFSSQYYTKMRFETDINFKIRARNASINPATSYFEWTTQASDAWGSVTVRLTTYKKDITDNTFTVIGSTDSTYSYENIQIPSGSTNALLTSLLNIKVQTEFIEFKPTDEVFSEITIITNNPSDNVNSMTFAGSFYNNGSSVDVLIDNSSRFLNVVDNKLQYNDEVTLNKLLPCDVKCSDFLMGLVKLFNLYIDEEKGITNRLRIEPRDDYYGAGELVDWTNKLDVSKSIDITPLSELTTKDFEFTYKSDADYWNKNYTDNTTQIYGYKKVTTDNDFVKGVSKIETLFSPSPQVEYAGTGLSLVEIKKVTESDGSVVDNNTKANTRILYYGGLKTYSSNYINNVNIYKFWFPTGNTTTFSPQRYYPYAGMEDDGYVSYTSLGYGLPIANQYFRPVMSNGTLYNRYWSRYIFEIANKNSKSVSCSIYLTPEDIFKLDFRNTFYINGIYYRLNKISDYSPLNNETTRCEFIKVEDTKSFVTEVKDINGGNDDGFEDSDDDLPKNNLMPLRDSQARNIGLNNIISNQSYTVLVNGNNNNISQNSNNVSIIGGDNNTIFGGLNNVTVIGTNNITINDSNTTVINGQVTKDGITLPSMNVNDGGLDIVYSLSSSITTNVWEAGDDVVINIGSTESNNAIDGSLDIVYEA